MKRGEKGKGERGRGKGEKKRRVRGGGKGGSKRGSRRGGGEEIYNVGVCKSMYWHCNFVISGREYSRFITG